MGANAHSVRKNCHWNLVPNDGKSFAGTFCLNQCEYAEIKAHLLCEGDCLFVMELDYANTPEDSTVYADLAKDGCNDMVVGYKNPRVTVSGPGCFMLSRRTDEFSVIQGMHIEANVKIYKAQAGIGILPNDGFGCAKC